MTFFEHFSQYSWNEIARQISRSTTADVERSLARVGKLSVSEFTALLSPAAKPYLEEMAQLSHAITQRRFGNTIQLFAPIYLSNECSNICTYCGFRYDNKIERKTLNNGEILSEVSALRRQGFEHILIVTGEASRTVGVSYLSEAIKLIRPLFSNITVEVQPLEQSEYELLVSDGLYGVLVYQETYHQANYRLHHPKGKKSNFRYRLETPDRIGRAGVYKIGLGALLGLEDWRVDSWFVALHLAYLRKKYWQSKFSISFPRLRPAEGVVQPKSEISDSDLVQLLCAFRLFDENVELSISTRENPTFREKLIPLGVTSMSAGSKTEPGGYTQTDGALKQFETSDERSPSEFAARIQMAGYEPVWKDWDQSLNQVVHGA